MHYRARYYNPGIGRFISEDPLNPQSLDRKAFRARTEPILEPYRPNPYFYVDNEPIQFTDPSGLIALGYGNWCGPGPFTKRGKRKPPIDDLDECCMAHDKCYEAVGLSWADVVKPPTDPKKKCDKYNCDEPMCRCISAIRGATGHKKAIIDTAKKLFCYPCPPKCCRSGGGGSDAIGGGC
jgi:RHS repeat-associated protein